MTEDTQHGLRIKLVEADLDLKQRQARWESPKAIAAIVAATAVLFGTLAGLAGYKFGSQPSTPTIIVNVPAQPGGAKP